MAENYQHLQGSPIDPRDMNTVDDAGDLLNLPAAPSFQEAYANAKSASKLKDQMDMYNSLSNQMKKKK